MNLSPALEVDVSARLCASLDRNSIALESAEARKRQMAAEVSAFEGQSLTFLGSASPFAAPGDWGPKSGWNWAIQTVTVTPLGSTDVLKLYRGVSSAGNLANRLKFSFIGSSTVDTVTWHPGRTALVLHGTGRESLVFGGTLTSGTNYFVNFEIVQVTDAQLPYFLL